MTEAKKLLQRQSRWQRSRKALSWPEKVRIAERLRPSIELWRASTGEPAAEKRLPPGPAGDFQENATAKRREPR
jgi:hypothetical protein